MFCCLCGALFYVYNPNANIVHMLYLLSCFLWLVICYSQISFAIYNVVMNSFMYMFYHIPIHIVFLLLFLKCLQNMNYLITLATVHHIILQKDFKMFHAQSNI